MVGGRSPTRVSPLHPAISVALLALVIVIRLGVIRNAPLDPDESEHLNAAWLVAEGRVPFLDFWDHHAPLFFYLLAPVTRWTWDDPGVYFVARTLMAATSGAALYLVYRLARRLSAGAALAAVLLLAVLPRFVDQTTEVRPDVPALVAWLGTLLALVRWRESARPGWLWLAGLALGSAAALNLKTAYGILGVAVVVALPSRAAGPPASARLARLLAGTAVGPGLVVARLWLAGGAPALAALGDQVGLGNLQFADFRKELPLSGTGLGLLALAAAGIARALRRDGRRLTHPLHPALLAPMASISLCLLLPTTPGVGIYAWLPVLAPAAVYAGCALATLLARAATDGLRRRAVAGAALAAALLVPAIYSVRLALVDENAAALATLRALLRHACPGEPVLDGMALAVFRPPAYRYRAFILGIREWIATGVIPEPALVEEIRRAGPRVAHADRRLRAILQVSAFVDRHYVPHPDGILVPGAAIAVAGGPLGGRARVDLVAGGPYRLMLTNGLAVTIDRVPVRPGVVSLPAGPHEIAWTGPAGSIRLAAATCPERAPSG
jgi:4-amino-4-deoxy-L-arabinose transferase-like glycosyltransferase